MMKRYTFKDEDGRYLFTVDAPNYSKAKELCKKKLGYVPKNCTVKEISADEVGKFYSTL